MSQSLVSVVAEGIPITTLTIGYRARGAHTGQRDRRFDLRAKSIHGNSSDVIMPLERGQRVSTPLSLSLSLYIPLSSICLAIAASCRITLERTPHCFSLFSPGHRDRFSIVERRGTPLRDTLWRRARLERYLSPIFDTGIRDRWALSLSLHRSALPPSSFAGPLSEGRTNEVWVFDGLLEGDRMTIMRNKTSPKESLGRLGSETIWC